MSCAKTCGVAHSICFGAPSLAACSAMTGAMMRLRRCEWPGRCKGVQPYSACMHSCRCVGEPNQYLCKITCENGTRTNDTCCTLSEVPTVFQDGSDPSVCMGRTSPSLGRCTISEMHGPGSALSTLPALRREMRPVVSSERKSALYVCVCVPGCSWLVVHSEILPCAPSWSGHGDPADAAGAPWPGTREIRQCGRGLCALHAMRVM